MAEKSEYIGIRVSPEERRKLRSLARASGLTVTGVILTMLDQADAILTVRPRVVVRGRHDTQRNDYVAVNDG